MRKVPLLYFANVFFYCCSKQSDNFFLFTNIYVEQLKIQLYFIQLRTQVKNSHWEMNVTYCTLNVTGHSFSSFLLHSRAFCIFNGEQQSVEVPFVDFCLEFMCNFSTFSIKSKQIHSFHQRNSDVDVKTLFNYITNLSN